MTDNNLLLAVLVATTLLTGVLYIDHLVTANTVTSTLSEQPEGTCINIELYEVCNEPEDQLLMWAETPTDVGIMGAKIVNIVDNTQYASAEETCNKVAREMNDEFNNAHIFCIPVSGLEEMRINPLGEI